MKKYMTAAVLSLSCIAASAQIASHFPGLSVGGYGEVALTRNFYSDNVYRYSHPDNYRNDPGHGRFDIPHAVIYLGYDFGKGWTMQTEIEFEHTGTGSAVEKEYTEAGEWETEIEKGGEVELEQFWIQKSFFPQLNVRMGHLVVPVGGLNNAHEPLNFFTVYRPEGEYTILPSTWHDTGISIWGKAGAWRYEALLVSPYEYKVANNCGFAARIDNTSFRNLRLSLSGYYGNSMHNSYPNDMHGTRYGDIKGQTAIGAFDFAYNGKYLIVRGNADAGFVDDAATISTIKRNLTSNNAPYKKTPVGKAAVAAGVEAGYDILHLMHPAATEKLFLFGRYEYYDPYIPAADQQDYPYTDKHRLALGLNWYPIPQIAVKCEWSKRWLKSQYNNEPSVSVGIAYMGFFNKQ